MNHQNRHKNKKVIIILASVFALSISAMALVLVYLAKPHPLSHPLEPQVPISPPKKDFNLKQFLIENSISYEVKAHDSPHLIARKFKTTPELIAQINKPETPDPSNDSQTHPLILKRGMVLKVPQSGFQIEVDVPNKILLLKLKNVDKVLKKYHITTGAPQTPTPIGNFKVVNKIKNPTWHSPKGAVPPNDPQNELGSRWMGIESQEIPKSRGFGIHGTIRPEEIGEDASTGCVRLINSEVEELFDLVVVGTPIVIK